MSIDGKQALAKIASLQEVQGADTFEKQAEYEMHKIAGMKIASDELAEMSQALLKIAETAAVLANAMQETHEEEAMQLEEMIG